MSARESSAPARSEIRKRARLVTTLVIGLLSLLGGNEPVNAESLTRFITTGTDDAEQLGSGAMRLSNSDLELVVKQGDVQQVGLRFTDVQIPAGASIESAFLQFRANGISTGPVLLTIKTQDSANPPTFAFGTGNISNRPTGNQTVSWSPPDWPIDNEEGVDQQAVVTAVIQEAVLRSGWAPGNAIVLIFTGSGTRVANALEGDFATALHVDYSIGGPPPNQPPLADAGPDQQGTTPVPATATLTGSGSDPENGTLTYAWTQSAGPNADIASPTSATTTVSLPAFGTYTFELTVTDPGGLSDSDQVVVTALSPSAPVTIEVPVATGADDGEEKVAGRVTLTNGDLDLVLDTTDPMVVGLRFTGINIPAGATITGAYIQFRADETQGDPTSLLIEGHNVGDAPALTAAKLNITNRPRTTAEVNWDPPPWSFGAFGEAQRTPDLKPIISELKTSGWTPGKAMVFIISGSGKRTADSVEGGFAPRLVITYAP